MKVLIGSMLSFAIALNASAQIDCSEVEKQFDQTNKGIASIFADGIGDNSAPRETNRQLKEMNLRMKQQVLMASAIAQQCDVSLLNPNGFGSYIGSAISCSTEQLKGNYKADICEMSNWTRSETK